MKRYSVVAALAVGLMAAPIAGAADVTGSRDFPSISRFSGSEIVDYRSVEFDESTLPVKALADSAPPAGAVIKPEGRITSIRYLVPAGKTALEVMRNYEQALGPSYKTVFKCGGDDCGSQLAGFIGNSGKVMPTGWTADFDTARNRYLLAQRSTPAGDVYALVYVMDGGNRVTVYQEVVEVKPMQGGQVTVLDAAALKRGLDSEGKVAVYGVYFDTAKADVKPESKPSLDEMAKLLTSNPTLKVYIVGHTDNAGALAANLELSQHRADAVVKALSSTYRISPDRMVARGVASLAPVASNTDDAGRARNRRVELVVQ
jgi:outer membrane protein OmpA-like peptidoglycan-associated protein